MEKDNEGKIRYSFTHNTKVSPLRITVYLLILLSQKNEEEPCQKVLAEETPVCAPRMTIYQAIVLP